MSNQATRRRHAADPAPTSGGQASGGALAPLIALALLGAALWSYWPLARTLFKEWQHDDNYSVGMLVPLVALYLVWRDRRGLGGAGIRPCFWAVALLVAAHGARTFGLVFLYESLQRYSMVLTVVALVLLVAGWAVFRRTIWIWLFLLLMVPLPGRVHNLISGPLQSLAASGSVFLLEAFGVTVSQDGHVIMLNNRVPLAVAEACSGLRMLTAFVVVAATMAFLVDRPRWQKAVLVVSSVPVAIACNLIRLCVTAVLYLLTSSELAERFFHDFAGWTMMPLAIFALMGELWIMKRLVVSEKDADGSSSNPSGRRPKAGLGSRGRTR